MNKSSSGGSWLSLLPSQEKNRYVKRASPLDITDETLASSLVPVQWSSLAPPVSESGKQNLWWLKSDGKKFNPMLLKADRKISCFWNRTAKGSNPRESRGLHTHTLKPNYDTLRCPDAVMIPLIAWLEETTACRKKGKTKRNQFQHNHHERQVREVDQTSYPDVITGALLATAKWCVPSPPACRSLRLFRRPTHTPSRSWACAVCQLHNKVSRHYGKWTKRQASYTRQCPCTATSG